MNASNNSGGFYYVPNTIQPTITTSGTPYVQTAGTVNIIDTGGFSLPAPEPKRLSDREWLDAEVEEVCARAA